MVGLGKYKVLCTCDPPLSRQLVSSCVRLDRSSYRGPASGTCVSADVAHESDGDVEVRRRVGTKCSVESPPFEQLI